MLYCCFVVLLSSCIVVLMYCHIVVMLYCCFVVLLSLCIVVLMYFCIVVMLYCCLVVLLSQFKKQHGTWCSRRCWCLVEDFHLGDSLARWAFPHYFNPPPPSPPTSYVTEVNSERNDTWSVAKHLSACTSQKQDEPPPPYPQRLCLVFPWSHPPWPQIMARRLLMSPLQAPGGRVHTHCSSFPCLGCWNGTDWKIER